MIEEEFLRPPPPKTPRVAGVDELVRELRLFNHHKSADMLDLLATSLQWQEDERCVLVRRARRAEDALDARDRAKDEVSP